MITDHLIGGSHFRWTDGFTDQVDNHIIENTEEQPDGDTSQGGSCSLTEFDRKEDRKIQPESHITDTDQDKNDDP